MDWIKLSEDNVPLHEEVLAVNIAHDFLLGYISKGKRMVSHFKQGDVTGFVCESDHELLENVTHYVILHLPTP